MVGIAESMLMASLLITGVDLGPPPLLGIRL
jgi:hypothetical protein